MGPASHFLVGMLCGAAIGAIAVALRRRLILWLPPFMMACGLWAALPYVLGVPEAAHPLANVFFGYAWLHPWLRADEGAGFFLVVGLANLLALAYSVFLVRFFGVVDMVRWERNPPPKPRRSRQHRGGRR
mgnify:CR=1 FL=1